MEPLILHIETSTDVCSVALSRGNYCVAAKENAGDRNHAAALAPFIDDVLREGGVVISNLDAVAVSMGPGSYTGLRIGLSTAKGVCYGGNIPLIGVPTLQAMCQGFMCAHDVAGSALLCPMIDARRMEVYTAFYDNNCLLVRDVAAEIITGDSFMQNLDAGLMYFFGNGAGKCRDVILHGNAVFVDDITQSASNMIALAVEAFDEKRFEDVAYCEPFYLKDFIAGVKKKLIPD